MAIQTWAFVAFNKVMTAQYSLWFMSLIPFVAINNKIVQGGWYKGVILYINNILFAAVWGYFSYQLEFQGINTFREICYSNYSYFLINVVSMVVLILNHQLTITFEMEGEYTVKNMLSMIEHQRKINFINKGNKTQPDQEDKEENK